VTSLRQQCLKQRAQVLGGTDFEFAVHDYSLETSRERERERERERRKLGAGVVRDITVLERAVIET
jgi:hypothetical protein